MTTPAHVLKLLTLSAAGLLLGGGCGGASETRRPSTSEVFTPSEKGEDQIQLGAAAGTPRRAQVAPHPEAPPPAAAAAAPAAPAAAPATPAAKADSVVVAEAEEDAAAEETAEPAAAKKSRKSGKKSHKKSRKKRR